MIDSVDHFIVINGSSNRIHSFDKNSDSCVNIVYGITKVEVSLKSVWL